ncbi:MAG: 30S ribosomal protein S12 methylthiotransferase RimO [Bacteroidales bacterium]|nr:30S ribosomal protein S12 methylthiotransferase RimO [Bacteroidales bacterium]
MFKEVKVQLITLGCSKNRVDSEHLLRQMKGNGLTVIPETAPLEGADVDAIVINTCGFIQDAKEESIDAIFTAVELKRRQLVKYVYVLGCLSERYRDELIAEIPEVDAFFGVSDTAKLLEALGARYNKRFAQERVLTTPSHYAYLKISEGCDRKCAYCAIPGIRGAYRSVPMELLLKEAQGLARKGVKELIVVAQDTTYYGLDIYKKRMLAPLLNTLAAVEGIEWVRLLYSYPADFPEDVLEEIATNEKICKYLDIPLQHSSSKVLSAMKRNIDDKQTKDLVKKIRKAVPGVALRTTLMVGHPFEGAAEFKELLSFVKSARFERLGAFTYSEEEGTYGARFYKDTISVRVKQERFNELMDLQSEVSLNFNKSRLGNIEKVLIDFYEDGYAHGRSQYEAPEVDGEILIECKPSDVKAGEFVLAKITEADCYDLKAELVKQ